MKTRILFLLGVFFSLINANAQQFTVEGIQYNVTNTTTKIVDIVDYIGTSKDVVIPNSVGYNASVYRVAGLERGAFENKELTSVVILEGVTRIGDRSFLGNQLTSIVIPEGVRSIGEHAFGSNQLTNVVIPESVTFIRHGAFRNNKLKSLVIPSKVVNIERFAFLDNDLEIITSLSLYPRILAPNVFDNRENIGLIIPKGSKQAYLDKGWTGFYSITEAEFNGECLVVEAANAEDSYEMCNYKELSQGYMVYNNMIKKKKGLESVSVDAIINKPLEAGDAVSFVPFSLNGLKMLVGLVPSLDLDLTRPARVIENSLLLNSNLEAILYNYTTQRNADKVKMNYFDDVVKIAVETDGVNDYVAYYINNELMGSRVVVEKDVPLYFTYVILPLGGAIKNLRFDTTGNANFGAVAQQETKVLNSNVLNATFVNYNSTTELLSIALAKDTTLNNVAVYSVSGIQVLSSGNTEVSVASLAAGVYIVRITTNKGVLTKRIVKS